MKTNFVFKGCPAVNSNSSRIFLLMMSVCFFAGAGQQDRADLEKKIGEAIVKGVEFLRKPRSDGSWISGPKKEGSTALVVYTLLRCKDRLRKEKYIEFHDLVENGIKVICDMKYVPSGGDEQYAIALSIMALEAHNRKKHADKIKELVHVLLTRQDPSGGWGYTSQAGDKTRIRPDVSITQYVVLGLFAAFHGGVRIENRVFQKALKWMLKAQFRNGTWACCQQGGGVCTEYRARQDYNECSKAINLNMTAAGLGTILLCEFILGKDLGDIKPEEMQAGIKKGEELLEKHWKDGKQEGKGHDYQHFYYLYGIERALTILDKEKIGKDDWYYLGAEKLVLPLQNQDGSFEHKETLMLTNHKVLQTSFALLFLTRATEAFFTH